MAPGGPGTPVTIIGGGVVVVVDEVEGGGGGATKEVPSCTLTFHHLIVSKWNIANFAAIRVVSVI